MLRNNLRLLAVGYFDAEVDPLSELNKINIDLDYKCINSISDIRSALVESDWDIIISNHALPSFDFMDALELLKESRKDIPFIVYSNNTDEKAAIYAIHSGAHDYIHKGNIVRLALTIERELKNVAIRRAKLQAESQIYRLAYYDELTGLPKRGLFCEKVTEILADKDTASTMAAIFFITFDRFPYINSTYGFSTGDTLIQQLSYRLSVYTSRNCLLTRLEGSKFAYFNGDIETSEDIRKFSNRIMRLVSTPLLINNLEFYVTFNMGICVYPEDGKDVSMLLANAESTLINSQDLWRNNCRYYIKEIGEASSRRIKLERALRKAISKNELLLHYQPIIDLQTGSILGAEALVRWNHPEFGLLSPDHFIPLAHETGIIIDIGKWVLQQACKQAKSWHDAGYAALSIAVNISAIELDQYQLINHISEILREIDMRPDLLELEITESVLMHDPETSIKTLLSLKEMGIKIAVDDFGTGYSSLSYLKRLPIDILKIDRSFTHDIDVDPDSLSIIIAIIALAKSLGLSVLAEGIETKDQFDFLYNAQCDRAQGFLFSKPVNAMSFMTLLEQRKTGTLA